MIDSGETTISVFLLPFLLKLNNPSIFFKEIVKDSGFAYVTNSQGTVSITYSNSSMGVSGGAIKLA